MDCPECGTPVPPIRKGRRLFCSQSCRLKAWRRQRHANDPERVRAEWREAHQRNREKRLSRMKTYHASHREEHKTYMRERHQRIREEDNQRRLAHHYANQEQANQKRRKNDQMSRLTAPWKKLLRGAARRAAKKNVPFFLTERWASNRWTGQCEVTGLPFSLGQRGSGPKRLSPSIDRIVPELGYTPENCRFVLWQVNAFKYDGTDAEMLEIARAIVSKLSAK